MQDFRNLEVRRLAREQVFLVCRATTGCPRDEMFGLRAQTRRAPVSICANIAEGCGRPGDGEFGRFLAVAMGSASESECEIIIALELEFLTRADNDRLVAGIRPRQAHAGWAEESRLST
jgi:four helix bundle protein